MMPAVPVSGPQSAPFLGVEGERESGESTIEHHPCDRGFGSFIDSMEQPPPPLPPPPSWLRGARAQMHTAIDSGRVSESERANGNDRRTRSP